MDSQDFYSIDKTLEVSLDPIIDLFRQAGTDSKMARELFEMMSVHYRGPVRNYKPGHGVGDSLPTDDPPERTPQRCPPTGLRIVTSES